MLEPCLVHVGGRGRADHVERRGDAAGRRPVNLRVPAQRLPHQRRRLLRRRRVERAAAPRRGRRLHGPLARQLAGCSPLPCCCWCPPVSVPLALAVLHPRVATPQRGSPQLPPLPLRHHHRAVVAVGVAVARHDGDVAASEHTKLFADVLSLLLSYLLFCVASFLQSKTSLITMQNFALSSSHSHKRCLRTDVWSHRLRNVRINHFSSSSRVSRGINLQSNSRARDLSASRLGAATQTPEVVPATTN